MGDTTNPSQTAPTDNDEDSSVVAPEQVATNVEGPRSAPSTYTPQAVIEWRKEAAWMRFVADRFPEYETWALIVEMGWHRNPLHTCQDVGHEFMCRFAEACGRVANSRWLA